MDDTMILSFPLQSDYMTTVRLATGGVCSRAGLNIDEGEDCKVCVTESLLLLMRKGFASARLYFTRDGGLSVRIVGEGGRRSVPESAEDEISCALLGALVGNLKMEETDGCIGAISFGFGK